MLMRKINPRIVLLSDSMDETRADCGHFRPQPVRHGCCEGTARMFSFLCIIAGLWTVASALFVLAFTAAGRTSIPVEEPEAVILRHAA